MQNTLLTIPSDHKESVSSEKVLSKEENERIYEECKSHLLKIAKIYHKLNPFFDIDEIISEAWLRGVRVSNPKYYKNRIRYNVIDFFRDYYRTRRKDNFKELTCLFDILHDEERDISFVDLFTNPRDGDHEKKIQDAEYYNLLVQRLNKVGLTNEEVEIFELYFFKEYTPTQISMILGDTDSFVNNKIRVIKNKIIRYTKDNKIIY